MLALLTLTGCSYASQDCSQGMCGVHLNGSGAHITINCEIGTCTPNESLQVSGFEVTCRGIDADQLTMEVSR